VSPVTDPLPFVAATVDAVTRPPNKETDASVTFALSHVEPLAADEPNATIEPDAGCAEGPRPAAGVP